MFRAAPAIAAVLVLGGLGACGSSASGSSVSESQKSARQIWTDAWNAWAKAPAIHYTGTESSQGTTVTLTVDATPTSVSASATGAGQTAQEVVLNGMVYQSSGTGFSQLSGSAATSAMQIVPTVQAQCEISQHGVLTKGAVSTVNGVPVVEISSDASVPGSTPLTLYVATSGTPRIIRVVITGAQASGGPAECSAAGVGPTAGTLTMTYPAHAPSIIAPATTAGGRTATGSRAAAAALTAADLPSSLSSTFGAMTQTSDGTMGNLADSDQRTFATADKSTLLEIDLVFDSSATAASADYTAYRQKAASPVVNQSSSGSPDIGQQSTEYVGTDGAGASIGTLAFQDGPAICVVTIISKSGTVTASVIEDVAGVQDAALHP